MTTLLKMAWRNIWRNKFRTLITMAAVAFAVFFASFQVSFQKGAWDNMIESAVNKYFGYVQVHGLGYSNEQTLDKAILVDEKIEQLNNVEKVQFTVPRIESFALASYGQSTTGVLVIGVDPEREDRMTGLQENVEEGEYFAADETAALIAGGVAEKLSLGVGDTLVIISQGFRGVNAAGKFPVKGIFNYPLPDLNKRLVYLPLKAAQYFYGAEDRITSLVLKIEDRRDVPQAVTAVNKNLPAEDYEVKDWQEMMPELIEARQLDEAGGILILALLYLIIMFGIFGTILMMTKEREYEFGVLTAIGMGRWQLFGAVWLETAILGLLGSILGILLSIPIVHYFATHPINVESFGEGAADAYEKFGIAPVLQGTFEWGIFFDQALIILIATTIMAFYPMLKIFRLKPVEAMRD